MWSVMVIGAKDDEVEIAPKSAATTRVWAQKSHSLLNCCAYDGFALWNHILHRSIECVAIRVHFVMVLFIQWNHHLEEENNYLSFELDFVFEMIGDDISEVDAFVANLFYWIRCCCCCFFHTRNQTHMKLIDIHNKQQRRKKHAETTLVANNINGIIYI